MIQNRGHAQHSLWRDRHGVGWGFTFLPFYHPGTFHMSALLLGTSIACFSFMGFDAMTTLAEEIKNPGKTLSKATIIEHHQECPVCRQENGGNSRVSLKFPTPFFKEFVVNFDTTDKSVEEINKGLREYNIFGGKDVSQEFPELEQCALFCVTEIHTKEEIDQLVSALKAICC